MKQKRKPWQPLTITTPTAEYVAKREQRFRDAGAESMDELVAIAINDTYQVVVERMRSGARKLSIHRHDRRAVRDWRHLQQIKSEVLGPDALAVEVFPPDHLLFDTSNEYHLWELPGGASWFNRDEVPLDNPIWKAHEMNAGRVAGEHRGRQRPIQPGLTVYEDRLRDDVQ